jgi:AmmeMemoRadiSam system protein B
MSTTCQQNVRPPIQAGHFYDADADALRATVGAMLGEQPPSTFRKPPLALLAPHAGYMFSGAVAAAAYRTVQGQTFDRALILAPTHVARFVGAALPPYAAFATPLGRLPVDQEAVGELQKCPCFAVLGAAHDEEHAIEVELPFLQVALAGPFHILPLTIGELPDEGLEPIAESLSALLQERRQRGQRWLIVASSDTYHGHDHQACHANDERLIEMLTAMDAKGLAQSMERRDVMACGWKALALTMMLAQRLGARQCRILDRRDSNDAVGASDARDGRYVVGYVSAVFE